MEKNKTIYLGLVDEVIPNVIKPVNEDEFNYEDIIPFGSNNLFPEEMTALARQSAYLRGVINSKVTYCGGTGFDSTDASFLTMVEEMGLHNSYRSLLLDDFIVGNSYLEIVTDDNSSFVRIFHQDTTKPRVATKNKGFILNPDWESNDETKNIKIPSYPKFRRMGDGLLHSLIHVKDYEPGFRFYGIPDNYAGTKPAVIDSQADTWNEGRLKDGFSSDGIIYIPGINGTEEAKKVKNDLINKRSGAKVAGGWVPIFLPDLNAGETRERPEFQSLKDVDDGSWINITKLASEKILIANGWFASLAAFPQNTGFDTERIINDYKVAKINVINPIQNKWLNIFKKIFSDFGFNSDLEIVNQSPIEQEDKEVMTVNERREALGKEHIEGGDVLIKKTNGESDNSSTGN